MLILSNGTDRFSPETILSLCGDNNRHSWHFPLSYLNSTGWKLLH